MTGMKITDRVSISSTSKKFLSIILCLTMLLAFAGCTKKDEQIALCLNSNDLQGAITAAEKADAKSIAEAEPEIKAALILMLNSELNTVRNELCNTELYLVNPDIIDKFKEYKKLIDILNFDWENSNVKTFVEKICSLEEYVKYNKVGCLMIKSEEYHTSMNDWLEKGINSLFYRDVCLDEAIAQITLAESLFKSCDDEYMETCYNYYSECTKILKRMQSEGQLEDVTNKYENEFLELTTVCFDATDDIGDVLDNLPKSIH